MARSKKEIVTEMIELNWEDKFKMEVVRDANKAKGTDPKAREQVKAAELRITEIEGNIAWLNEYIKTL